MSQIKGNKREGAQTYGAVVSPSLLVKTLDMIRAYNTDTTTNSGNCASLVIWGRHGIGKTQVVKDYCKERNIEIRTVNCAQFEEMGDLVGMPTRDDENQRTVYLRPEFAPKGDEETEGILFLDDVNRADDRILRGIMQLFQDYKLVSWSVPKKWTIVASCNPEGGEYSVTQMDEAMKTRLYNVTMVFNIEDWLAWANKAQIDIRVLSFVVQQREIMKNECPRSFTEFARIVGSIQDWMTGSGSSKELNPLVEITASAKLNKETKIEFLKYVSSGMVMLIDPKDIVDCKTKTDWANLDKQFDSIMQAAGSLTVGIISTQISRIASYVVDNLKNFSDSDYKAIVRFLLNPHIDNAQRAVFITDCLNSEANKHVFDQPKRNKFFQLTIPTEDLPIGATYNSLQSAHLNMSIDGKRK